MDFGFTVETFCGELLIGNLLKLVRSMVRTIFVIQVMWSVLAIVGVIFSLIILIGCLKRPMSKFYNPLTNEGKYDKLI